jgi:hypothetical protein
MTHKDIAERLREIIAYQQDPHTRMEELADELDPPRPEPGTVVWYKFTREPAWSLKERWRLGIVTVEGDALWTVTHDLVLLCDVEYKPARILADDEVPATVPSIRAPFDYLILKWHYVCNGRDWGTADAGVRLTSDDVERMEAER